MENMKEPKKENMENTENKPLTTFDIGKFCKVSHRTVQQWITSGILKAYRTPGNHSRVDVKEFLLFLKEYQMPIPEELSEENQIHKRVLVVDDDKTVTGTIREILKRSGQFEIQEAYDGFSAGQKFAAFRPQLITLDITIPYLNGFEVLKLIRGDERNKHVKIVIISGLNQKEDIQRALNLGADAFIAKPFTAEMLVKTVQDLWGKK